MLCYLDNQPVPYINSSLKTTIDVSQAVRLEANLNQCFQGVIPVGKGFYVTEQQVKEWLKADPKNQDVLKLSSSAGDLTDNPNGKPSRWIIDFQDMSIEEVSDYVLPFRHVRDSVKPEREKNREAVMREKWWRFKRTNAAMRKALAPLPQYFNMPSHSKWFIPLPASKDWLANNSTNVVASDDFYILGILTSNVHRTWVKAQSSTLEDRTRYTHNTCFETFPFPQTPSPLAPLSAGEGNHNHSGHPSPPGRRAGDEGLIQQIRATAQDLHAYRSTQMEKKQWGITKLYNEYFYEPTS